MDSDFRTCKNCPQTIPYKLFMFYWNCLFLFPNSFWYSVNKLDINSSPSLLNVSALVKPYYFMAFVNIGNGITGIEPMLTNFTMSSGWFGFYSVRVMIDSLDSINWTLSLLSVGDSNTLKLSSASVKLMILCWIECWLPPLFFCFLLLIWRWLSPFSWLVSLLPWFTLTW